MLGEEERGRRRGGGREGEEEKGEEEGGGGEGEEEERGRGGEGEEERGRRRGGGGEGDTHWCDTECTDAVLSQVLYLLQSDLDVAIGSGAI